MGLITDIVHRKLSFMNFREWIVAVLQVFIFGLPELILFPTAHVTGRLQSASCGGITGFHQCLSKSYRFQVPDHPHRISTKIPKKKNVSFVSSQTQCTSKAQGTLAVRCKPCPSKDFSYPFHPWQNDYHILQIAPSHQFVKSVRQAVREVDDVHGRT